MEPVTQPPKHRVVIIGGGFGGLYAAQSLKNADVDVTLIDKRNFHLFQPLLYQVATGNLSPADISSPLRSILSRQKNVRVLMEEATDIDPETQQVMTSRGAIPYDSLIVATGVSHHYFGNDQWKDDAPGLKTIEDAIEMRRRIFSAFEAAEKETDPEKRKALLTFVVVGGGPTGVELAGAIAELANHTLKQDFRSIDTTEAQILLIEGLDRVLPPYPADLSVKAAESLTKLGVTVRTKTKVTQIDGDNLTLEYDETRETISAKTILWAAGVKASGVGRVISDRTGASLDRVGRVMVESDLSVPNHPSIFVIGDLAHCADPEGKPYPGVAPVAMQEGKYVARLIKARLSGQSLPRFLYKEFGSLAVIGQNAAVANLGGVHLSGFIAWFIWIVAHIYFLIEFDNKLVVMIQWVWNYVTRSRGARIITDTTLVPGESPSVRSRKEEPVNV
ncbi:NAD(P)/FAD-dependent oxidoreductase [Leptolyngbya sp. NIES-2104]|uniref:NAD(P)/FAD-dependent oxidoreductase n=1 Tax=Leptolyngbya sp. NIES-2104 TaxID=1552121 RepID=UPI0006EC5E13|nr:NAD(P)/FAD-dependent oxidoreductase [Leptolyngbya sp. NIES-2104]GAP97062.1 NADH dehydrogenase [Leptolyngbya sp. NIES-2104]